MASNDFPISRTPAKFQEFLSKLQSVGTPDKVGTAYPASIGFGSSHARGFPFVMKNVGLLDSSGAPTDAYKKGLRGGPAGRSLIGDAIRQAYKPMFTVYPDAATRAEGDLVTFVKSNSDLDEKDARLVVRTFKVLCTFAEFSDIAAVDYSAKDDQASADMSTEEEAKTPQKRAKSGNDVVINVNISLSVDATSDPAVYDAFFAAMAKHLGGLTDGA